MGNCGSGMCPRGFPTFRARDLVHPPEKILTDWEEQALRSIKLTDAGRSALRKGIANATATAFFDWFALIDAVDDPRSAHHDEVRLAME
ncbi:MAG: hypothetical protein HY557_01225 [Euryarchaeota archaeon]|nr:hypothetical protein [Euryarchaeota archaeon]